MKKVLALGLALAAAGALGAEPLPFSRGVNLTGWFQAGGAHQISALQYGAAEVRQLRALGVEGVRLPVDFASLAGPGPEYRLDPLALDLLEGALATLTAGGLAVVVDNHSDLATPAQRTRLEAFLTALWPQVAARLKTQPPTVVYELQNEPHDLAPGAWQVLQERVLARVRAVDPGRLVVLTGDQWGGIDGLTALKPSTDPHVVYSFHFYDPFRFTHQGADWAGQADLKGVRFPVGDDLAALGRTLDRAVAWARAAGADLWCGEGGVYNRVADPQDRVAWYAAFRSLLADRRLPWTTWDYRGSFGLFQKGAAEVFPDDLNRPLAGALGFRTEGLASEPAPGPVGTWVLYGDDDRGQAAGLAWAPGWWPPGAVDFYDGRSPAEGRYSLTLKNLPQYAAVGWDFHPLRSVAAPGSVVFWARSSTARFGFDLRFVDGGPGLPWRWAASLGPGDFPGDGAWHRVEVPFERLRETGAWDGAWHDPVAGAFDPRRVARFEVVTEAGALGSTVLGIDGLEVRFR